MVPSACVSRCPGGACLARARIRLRSCSVNLALRPEPARIPSPATPSSVNRFRWMRTVCGWQPSSAATSLGVFPPHLPPPSGREVSNQRERDGSQPTGAPAFLLAYLAPLVPSPAWASLCSSLLACSSLYILSPLRNRALGRRYRLSSTVARSLSSPSTVMPEYPCTVLPFFTSVEPGGTIEPLVAAGGGGGIFFPNKGFSDDLAMLHAPLTASNKLSYQTGIRVCARTPWRILINRHTLICCHFHSHIFRDHCIKYLLTKVLPYLPGACCALEGMIIQGDHHPENRKGPPGLALDLGQLDL